MPWPYRKARASVSHAVLAAWPAVRRITKVQELRRVTAEGPATRAYTYVIVRPS